MSFCTVDSTAGMYDSTPIENMFIAEHLPSAPDHYLRVYLYLRMLLLHPEMGDSPEEVCRALRIDADTLDNAMTYWERQGLVERRSDNPPTYAFLPILRGQVSSMDSDYYRYRDFNANLQAIFGAENLLHPRQFEMAHDWLNVFGLSQEAILLLAERQLKSSRSKKPDLNRLFRKLDDRVKDWANRGILTEEDARRALEFDGETEKTAAAVMKRLAMRRAATDDETRMVRKWLYEWNFSQQDILDACAETTAARSPSVAYLNSILESRHSRGDDGASFDELKGIFQELGESGLPTPDQLDAYGKLLARGFESETVRLAAIQCARKRRHHFADLEWMLDKWAADGVYTRSAAEAYLADKNRTAQEVRRLLSIAGMDRRAQIGDIALYEGWRAQYAPELIDYAAECARGMQMPMRYMDKLLAGWKGSGVQSVSQARVQHGSRVSMGGARRDDNPALNYEQRPLSERDYSHLYLKLTEEDMRDDGGTEQ